MNPNSIDSIIYGYHHHRVSVEDLIKILWQNFNESKVIEKANRFFKLFQVEFYTMYRVKFVVTTAAENITVYSPVMDVQDFSKDRSDAIEIMYANQSRRETVSSIKHTGINAEHVD